MSLRRLSFGFGVFGCMLLAMGTVRAGVGPFSETFENPSALTLYLTYHGWVVQSASGPPQGLVRWVPTFGENVSDRRNFSHGGNMPGYLDIKSLPATQDVGGDYSQTAYPIGFLDDYWFGSADRRWRPALPWNDNQGPDVALDDRLVKLQSRAFYISGNNPKARYLSFLVGGYHGNNDRSRVQIALTIKPGSLLGCPAADPVGQATWLPDPHVDIYTPVSDIDTTSLVPRVATKSGKNFANVPAVWRVPAVTNTGGKGEQMQLVVMDLWAGTERNPYPSYVCARVVILDDDLEGHINVDQILMSDIAELQARYPAVPSGTFGRPKSVHGYADLHTHWMNHLGTGAVPLLTQEPNVGRSLKGLLTTMGLLWGSPYYPPAFLAPELCGDGSASCGATSMASCSGVPPFLCTPSDPERRELAMPMCHRNRHEARWPQARYQDDTRHSNPSTSMVLELMSKASGSGTGDNPVGCAGIPFGDAFPFLENVEVATDCFHYSRGWNPDTQRYQMPMRPFMDVIHQQMYWEWVRRAYEGGLRLIVTDVGHSMAGEMLLNDGWWLNNDQGSDILYGRSVDDWYAVRRQTCAVKKMVSLVPEIVQFAEIAYNPQQARDIIARNKLAVVIGAEVDSLGSLRPNLFSGNPDKELDALQALGVRKITPIHLVDNANGGAAVYDKTFYSYTDALNLGNGMKDGVNAITVANLPDKQNSSKDEQWRLNQFIFDKGSYNGAHNMGDVLNDRIAHVADGQVIMTGAYNRFFDSQGNNCNDPDMKKFACWTETNFFQQEIVDTPCLRAVPGDCLNQRFAADATFQRPAAIWNILLQTQHQHVFAPKDAQPPADPLQQYWVTNFGAARNYKGLSSDGAAYLESAARRALLIDIDHMGEKSRGDVLSSSPVWTATCSGSLSFNQKNPDCQKNAYPVIATHAGVREARGVLSTVGEKTERHLDTEDLVGLLRSGGTVGIGAGYQVIDTPPLPRLSKIAYPDDCPGSAKALGSQYLWYIKKTETAGVFDRYGMPRPSAWLAGGVSIGSDQNGFAVQLNGRYNKGNGYHLTDTARCDTFETFGDPTDVAPDPNQPGRASLQDQQKNAVYYGDSPVPPEATTSANGISTAPPQRVLNKLFFTPGSVPDVQLGGGLVGNDGVPRAPFGVMVDLNGFDFNQVGVANIGLEPDLLQDMVNPARTDLYNFREMQYQMRHLFHGAEDFIEAWEKAEATCITRTGGSPTCTPQPPNDAESCDMWASDVDHIPTSLTGGTDDTPSCMDRCGQTLTYVDLNNNPAACDCFYNPIADNSARLCADFKPWCKYEAHVEYNCLPDPFNNIPRICTD